MLTTHLGRPATSAEQDDICAASDKEGRPARRFFDAYAARFGLTRDSVAWDFHLHREAKARPNVAGATFDELSLRMPISVTMLTGFAERGVWDQTYPAHIVVPRWYTSPYTFLACLCLLALAVYHQHIRF